MTPTRPRLAFAGVLTLVALTGCSGGGGTSGTAAGGTAGSQSLTAPAPRAAAGTTDRGAAYQTSAVGADVQQKAVIENGRVAVHTADPQRARDRVTRLLTRLRGTIDSEQTVYDTSGHIHDSHLVLRVPVATFGTAMTHVERLGTVVHSSSNATDVTTEAIDLRQRLQSLRISLHDLDSFQRQATDIGQLLRFENAITQRRGEFQSLKAQRDHLVNETTMSTITLDISVPVAHPVKATTAGHHAGFVTGLRHGWSALSGAVLVALTALGAVLPFAVVLLVVGLPVRWWVRRMARTRPAAAAADGPTAD